MKDKFVEGDYNCKHKDLHFQYASFLMLTCKHSSIPSDIVALRLVGSRIDDLGYVN